jgi:hypothetical protein
MPAPPLDHGLLGRAAELADIRACLDEVGRRPVSLTEGGDALIRHAAGIFARIEGPSRSSTWH